MSALPASGAWPTQPLPADKPPVEPQSAAKGASLRLNHRPIVNFRSHWLGEGPASRAEQAQEVLNEALASSEANDLGLQREGDVQRVELNGQPLFVLTPTDLGAGLNLGQQDAAARQVLRRLQQAVAEHRESRDPKALGRALITTLLASALALGALRLLIALRRRWSERLFQALSGNQFQGALGLFLKEYLAHSGRAIQWLSKALTLGLVLLLLDTWATFVLRQFAYTRPWGERGSDRLLSLLSQFAGAILNAIPQLMVALLILGMARLATQVFSAVMKRVEQGEITLGSLDAEIAMPTRRLGNLLIWLFALAMAYPYLPGADSEAFKGMTVLAGLMLSMGASGMVGQALAGLSLLYSRSLRVGEHVKMGETEGTVVGLSLFSTRLHTGMGEEICLPNTLVLNQPIRNFSRLVADGRFMLHTAITIGYDTPWRQVHAMLMEAAQRSAGVASEPPPYVVQTALSDFYVEYRLCAQSNRSAPHRRIEALNQLHGHIQDVFNEMGVQIMSPHFRVNPQEPMVVPPGPWASTNAPAGDFLQPTQAEHGAQKATDA
ncbi:mechanosensitive ion channel [Curvibacter sp. HBC28]|uniref:Small-conductance mechanosensitive channel n=1 Tax=Curvibacter microcysteis TaxID=3026419 RepID=A0ABT5MGZ3_9BURK|nr:mechanosensitive ion channel domain-containing protein [Curvibacter sp. HBC28]MDD0815269.1 mechanosensitive ion channel [Curvibacter sp. HBC28]